MRVSIHGVEVAVMGSLPASLLGELLGGFPPGDPARPPDLVIALEPASGPPPDVGRPLFFHGVVRARALDGAVVLTDGSSSAQVSADGGRVDVAVGPAAEADPHAFEHVLVLVALVLGLRHRGLFHLHAAGLVQPDGRTVLVVGGGGAGKSTLTLALLEHGRLGYLGDDALLLTARPGGPAVLACPRDFHASALTLAAFPRLAPLAGARHAAVDKRRLDPARAFPGRAHHAASAPALVLLPEITGAALTQVEPVAAAHALGGLLESSALLAVDGLRHSRAHLQLLGDLLAGAASFRVLLGRDLLTEPGRVAALFSA